MAERVVGASKHGFNLANHGLNGAKRLVSAAKKGLDVANRFLQGLAHAYQYAMKGLSWISKVGLGGLIHVKNISFDAQLSAARGGNFKAGFDVVFFRKYRKRFSININIRSISSIIQPVVKRMGSGFSSLF